MNNILMTGRQSERREAEAELIRAFNTSMDVNDAAVRKLEALEDAQFLELVRSVHFDSNIMEFTKPEMRDVPDYGLSYNNPIVSAFDMSHIKSISKRNSKRCRSKNKSR